MASPPRLARNRSYVRFAVSANAFLNLLHLRKLQLDGRRPAENRDRDLDARALLIDVLHEPVERCERAVAHAYRLADLEGDQRLGSLDPLLDLMENAVGLDLADRPRLAARAEKTRDLRR